MQWSWKAMTDHSWPIEHLLRGQTTPREGVATLRHRLAILILAGCGYGAAMGSYGGVRFSRLPQVIDSAIKVPLLLTATFWISLPSFFVLNTLMGLRNDFREALRALLGAQAGLTVILASLAPFTALCYVSGCEYGDAILFNGLMFAAASAGAQLVLRREYRPLIARNLRHVWMLRAWLAIYMFVGIQMGWVLRPFIGNPALPTRFLRGDAMTNAYVVVAHLVLQRIK